ncbi:unnamed protein product [Moneuplotes crassus]|uniref:Uncharacterized protein n=1 Tax=Euplotes crassus TaxID=5936 RepID=A0AAD1XYE4_EUPCR|nr:unnamed protein product [Moneuplotes crassus]
MGNNSCCYSQEATEEPTVSHFGGFDRTLAIRSSAKHRIQDPFETSEILGLSRFQVGKSERSSLNKDNPEESCEVIILSEQSEVEESSAKADHSANESCITILLDDSSKEESEQGQEN